MTTKACDQSDEGWRRIRSAHVRPTDCRSSCARSEGGAGPAGSTLLLPCSALPSQDVCGAISTGRDPAACAAYLPFARTGPAPRSCTRQASGTGARRTAPAACQQGYFPLKHPWHGWAWRKGQRYGTLICELEWRRVIELFPDREPPRSRPGCGPVRGLRSAPATATEVIAVPSCGPCQKWFRLPNSGAGCGPMVSRAAS